MTQPTRHNWITRFFAHIVYRTLLLQDRVLGISIIIVLSTFLCSAITVRYTGLYLSSITLLGVTLISFISGLKYGFISSVLLGLTNDYFFVEPVGSVLNNARSVEHFLIIVLVGLSVSLLMDGIKATFLDLQKTKNEAEAARELSKKSEQLKSKFLATMSHEIRTPLNGIIGLTEVLSHRVVDPNNFKYVQSIHQSGKTLLRIINDILDFSKIESGKLNLLSEKFSLLEVMNQLILTFTPLAQAKYIHFDCEIQEDTPEFVLGDADRLSQVLFNLVGNAIKFTPVGIVLVRIHPHPTLKDYIEFCVEDTGIGLTPESVSQLFTPFVQLSKVGTSGEPGTGLGLSISSGIVHSMGGEIHVESKLGKGSRFNFHVLLPAVANAKIGNRVKNKQYLIKELEKVEALQEHSQTANVLIVDDNPTNLIVAQAMLDQLKIHSIAVSNGKEALEAVKNNSFDLILMDCQMPVMDGFEATHILREQGYSIPIIAMTANAFKKDQEDCLSKGMSDYLSKPIALAPLRDVLLRHLTLSLTKKDDPAPALAVNTLQSLETTLGKDARIKIVRTFINTLPTLKNSVRQNLQSKNLTALHQLGHQFKASALAVGGVQLSQQCALLEHETEWKSIEELSHSLLTTVETLEKNLAQFLN